MKNAENIHTKGTTKRFIVILIVVYFYRIKNGYQKPRREVVITEYQIIHTNTCMCGTGNSILIRMFSTI